MKLLSGTKPLGPDMPTVAQLGRGVARFYRWLKWRAGADRQCHWRQWRMAEDLKVTVRTIQRWLGALLKAGLISIRRRCQMSAIITVGDDKQLDFNFSTTS